MGRTEAQTELGVRLGTRGGLKTHRLVSTQYARQAGVEHTAEGIDQGTAAHAKSSESAKETLVPNFGNDYNVGEWNGITAA